MPFYTKIHILSTVLNKQTNKTHDNFYFYIFTPSFMALVEMNEELSCLVSPAKDRCDGLQHRVGSKYK